MHTYLPLLQPYSIYYVSFIQNVGVDLCPLVLFIVTQIKALNIYGGGGASGVIEDDMRARQGPFPPNDTYIYIYYTPLVQSVYFLFFLSLSLSLSFPPLLSVGSFVCSLDRWAIGSSSRRSSGVAYMRVAITRERERESERERETCVLTSRHRPPYFANVQLRLCRERAGTIFYIYSFIHSSRHLSVLSLCHCRLAPSSASARTRAFDFCRGCDVDGDREWSDGDRRR